VDEGETARDVMDVESYSNNLEHFYDLIGYAAHPFKTAHFDSRIYVCKQYLLADTRKKTSSVAGECHWPIGV
jgi:hypothetical protein